MNQSREKSLDFSLTVTDAAAEHAARMVRKHGLDESLAGLRVGAYDGGCSGYMYDVRVEEAPEPEDHVVEINGLRVFVNDFSMPLVKGMKVDWTTSLTESRFVFSNPNATGECGCGVSFST